MNRRVLQVCKTICKRLARQGAQAVVLMGSRVRGDDYAESDIDLHAIGKGPYYRLELYQGFLISISWATARQDHRAFIDPGQVGGIILAWRKAIILYDPKGIAEKLKRAAQKWQWDSLDNQADKWVAEELTGYAEELHKLVGNLKLGRKHAASVQRSLLAIYMAPILAVHHRVLYDTENHLWDLVSARMGTEWAQLQSRALGEESESFEDTCRASLRLYVVAAQEIKQLLDERQYEVVANACRIAGYSL